MVLINEKNLLLDSDKIENIIKRLSCEIIEKNNNLKNLCIIGIKSRGDIIAKRIVEKIYDIKGENIELGYIDVTFYRITFSKTMMKIIFKNLAGRARPNSQIISILPVILIMNGF